MTEQAPTTPNPLHRLMGGWRGGLEAAAPSVGFAIAYLWSGSLRTALLVALGLAVVMAGLRLAEGVKPVRVLGGLLAVGVAAIVAARTGSAVDYFLPALLANLVSALAWALSILVGWPMLGMILGFTLRQGTAWRKDPDLVRAYSRASWIWAASFVVRAGVQLPLWLSDNVLGLGIVRVALGWPFVVGVIVTSWWVLRRSLPPDHPGIMHPRTTAQDAG